MPDPPAASAAPPVDPPVAAAATRLSLDSGAAVVDVSATPTPGGGQAVCVTLVGWKGGNPLLHWGVVGGPGFKGGWRLPASRPSGTVPYKGRALQTPFHGGGGGDPVLTLTLTPDEASRREGSAR